jgi:hypothetical protein
MGYEHSRHFVFNARDLIDLVTLEELEAAVGWDRASELKVSLGRARGILSAFNMNLKRWHDERLAALADD